MPPVPSSQIEMVSHKLIKHFSAKTVPTPASIDFVELQVPLQVRLTLTSQELPEFAMAQPLVLLVCLSRRGTWRPISRRALVLSYHQGKTYQVARQLDAEMDAINRLMALELVELAPSFIPNSGSYVSIWG